MATALILHPVIKGVRADAGRALADQLEEARGLAQAINLDVWDVRVVNVAKVMPGTLFGEGARKIIDSEFADNKPDIIIVNHALTPVQQRNLEQDWQTKVIDRTGLILEIFGARASTKEGMIQVELAALEYQRSRLVRSWTHLERQRGGAGFMGGPGETQLEIDRRIIDDKITALKKDLLQVKRTRQLQSAKRRKVPYPIVALVGYTNAGKSTLFNRMTGASVFAQDLLFATLDPTVRKITLPNKQTVMLSDTVGFISELPTQLIAAFRATLEQVEQADVILHVRDISSDDTDAQKTDVEQVLSDLGIDIENHGRIIEVWNKADLVDGDARDRLARKARDAENAILISAVTGQGVDALTAAIQGKLSADRQVVKVSVSAGDGKTLAWIHSHAHVLKQIIRRDRIHLTIDIDAVNQARLEKMCG